MNSFVPILKRMQEHKSIGDSRRMNDRGYVSGFHPLMGVEQSLHEALQIIRFWTNADRRSLPGDYIIVVFVFCSLVVVLVFVELSFFEFV
jgi:hypothetical protein